VDITPDDKDWTWVLDRPCPECGFDADRGDATDVVGMLREQVTSWQNVLTRSDVADRPSPTRWSPLEYACHVSDVFRIFDTRLELMLTIGNAAFENWNQDATAVAERYDLQDPQIVSRELAGAGGVLASRFHGVSGPQWECTGHRSNGSEFTVGTFALYLVHDPIHHLWDVSEG
jgi:hypothetical protein